MASPPNARLCCSINAQYGVMGTPMLVLFHNGHSVAPYNASSYSPQLIGEFIAHWTDYAEQLEFNTTELDYDVSYAECRC